MMERDGLGSDLPLVWVLSTGGTIASSGGSPTDLSNYSVGNLSGEDLLHAVPAIGQLARIKVEPIANVFSSDLTTSHWLTLSRRINEILSADPSVAGVVVTHGTNTWRRRRTFLISQSSARDATKTNTYRVETFRAPELGLHGQIDGDLVSFPQKARVLLMLALTRTKDPHEFRRIFAEY